MAFHVIIDSDGLYTSVHNDIDGVQKELNMYHLSSYMSEEGTDIPLAVKLDNEENAGAVIIATDESSFEELKEFVTEVTSQDDEEDEGEDD